MCVLDPQNSELRLANSVPNVRRKHGIAADDR